MVLFFSWSFNTDIVITETLLLERSPKNKASPQTPNPQSLPSVEQLVVGSKESLTPLEIQSEQ
jgi:hypothetical protein